MKKRRELNALVGNGKVRRKSRSGHELLRSNDSESSDGDDYSLSSTKSYVKQGSGSLCSTCTSVLGFLLLITCLLVSAGLTWMHLDMKKDLESLRQSLKTVESSSDGSLQDIQKLSTQLHDVNKTLHNLKSGSHGFEEAVRNLSSISDRISKLSGTVDKLNEAVQAAPELRNLPDKLLTVSKSVAALGSSVSTLQDKLETLEGFQKTAQSQMNTLSEQVSVVQVGLANLTGGRENGPGDLQLLQQLQPIQAIVKSTNETLWEKIALLQGNLVEHETHFLLLDNVTSQLSKNLSEMSQSGTEVSSSSVDLDSEDFKSRVEAIVRESLLSHRVATAVNMTDSEGIGISRDTMDLLLTKVNNLTNSVKHLQEQYNETVKSEGTDTAIDLGSQEKFMKKFEQLNASVEQLNTEVTHLSTLVGQQASQITSVTHEVDGLKGFVNVLEQRITIPGSGSNKTNTVTTVQSVEPAVEKSTHSPTSSNNSAATTPNAASPGTPPSHLSIPGVTDASTLRLNFSRWDKLGEGKVSYSVLPDYMGVSHTPPEDELKKYDKNSDNLYSLEEFAEALGIDLGDSQDESNSTTASP